MRYTIRILCVLLCGLGAEASASVVLDAPGHVIIEGNATLARGGEPGAAFTVIDWLGRPVEGAGGAFGEDGTALVPPLPVGYYRLVKRPSGALAGNAQDARSTIATLAVVSTPPLVTRHSSLVTDEAAPAVSFFAADTGPIWHNAGAYAPGRGFACPWNDGDRLKTLADLAWLCGLRHVRDRISAQKIMETPGSFDGSIYLGNTELFAERGIGVSGVFSSAPDWTVPLRKMPTDLAATFAMCERLALEFGDRMDAWEFWNEPDIGFAPGPVWDYAAAMKAAYLGFVSARRRGVRAASMPAGLCTDPGSIYAETLYDNDAAKFADGFNYHCYRPVSQIPSRFAQLRVFLERHGIGHKAVWITEAGCDSEGHAAAPGIEPGTKAHSPEQELFVAEACQKQLVALAMEGVARAYWFILGAYNERGGVKDWGMLRRDGTAKPVFSALATAIRELDDARIVGELDAGEGVRAFLYERCGTPTTVGVAARTECSPYQTVVFWAEAGAEGAALRLPESAALTSADGAGRHQARLVDMCGMASAVAAEDGMFSLPATRHPQFVSGLFGLSAAVPAHPAGILSPYVPAPDEDLAVIVRAELDEDDFAITRNKTRAVLKGDTGRMRVLVWNIGDNAKTGIVEVAGGRLEGLPGGPFALGPRGSPPAVFDCVFVPDGGGYETDLAINGRFNGRRGSRTCIPIWLERRFEAGCEAAPLDWRDPRNWSRYDSARKGRISFDEAENAMRFDLEWDQPSGQWALPRLRLAEGGTLAGAKALAFEVKTAQDKLENNHAWAHVQIAGFPDIPYGHPNGNWERRWVELPAGVPEETSSLCIGVAPRGAKLTLWIRNIELLRFGDKFRSATSAIW